MSTGTTIRLTEEMTEYLRDLGKRRGDLKQAHIIRTIIDRVLSPEHRRVHEASFLLGVAAGFAVAENLIRSRAEAGEKESVNPDIVRELRWMSGFLAEQSEKARQRAMVEPADNFPQPWPKEEQDVHG